MTILRNCLLLIAFVTRVEALADEPFEKNVRPFLQTYCISCHGEETQKGKIRLDHLSANMEDRKEAELWARSLEAIEFGEMPSDKADKFPTKAEAACGYTGGLQRIYSILVSPDEGLLIYFPAFLEAFDQSHEEILGASPFGTGKYLGNAWLGHVWPPSWFRVNDALLRLSIRLWKRALYWPTMTSLENRSKKTMVCRVHFEYHQS